MAPVVVDAIGRFYNYRVSVDDSVAGASANDLGFGFHNVERETVVVKHEPCFTVYLPRMNFRVRGRLTRTTRNVLDHLLYTRGMTRPMRKHTTALLCSLYPNGVMADAHVLLEYLEKESHQHPAHWTQENEELDPPYWRYRYPEPEPEPEQGEDEEDPRHLVGYEFAHAWRANPASRAAVEALLETTRVDEDDEGAQCTICLDPLQYTSGSAVATMPCSHSFHRDCILTWLHNRPLCPLCRFTLPT